MYFIENGVLKKGEANTLDHIAITILKPYEFEKQCEYLPEQKERWLKIIQKESVRMEQYGDMDILCIPIRDHDDWHHAHIFFMEQDIWLVSQNADAIQQLFDLFCKKKRIHWTVGKLLTGLLEHVQEITLSYLQGMEKQILDLESKVINKLENQNIMQEILTYRKQLLHAEHLFMGMQDIYEHLEMNESGYLEEECLKDFSIMAQQMQRIVQKAGSLQTYVTEIREAYQSSVDIQLNETMRIFTVITAVFLPFSLIAGWFGMNFDMQIFHIAWAYPAIACLSIVLSVGLLIYFKKHRWF